jgi:hypothetical protein
MAEQPTNLDIDQQTMDRLLANPSFMDAIAKKLGTAQAPKKAGGFVDAGDISGGAFPQMTNEQLYNHAKAVNKGINQEVALAQYNQLLGK